MAIRTTLEYKHVDALYLDPMNPRVGRSRMSAFTSQNELLEMMRSWVVDELALSYLGGDGFWTYEPLIAVEESLSGEQCLVVVEGNRRLAALKLLERAIQGNPVSTKWAAMVEGATIPKHLFDRVPHLLATSRREVQDLLGFRHVTGIKQWDVNVKASFIARLIDGESQSYRQVARKIGSTIPTVRRHYLSYRVLLQIEQNVDEFSLERGDRRFAFLFMTLDAAGVQQYLNIDILAPEDGAKEPVQREVLGKLVHFSRWLFGTSKISPLVTDTREVGCFGRILTSEEAVNYLESNEDANFDVAYRIARGDEDETIRYVSQATTAVMLALKRAHVFKASKELQKAVRRLGEATIQLRSTVPDM